MSYDTYTSPLATRNASEQMLRLWSPRHKFNTWRKIWLAVAEAQHELGLPVSKEQVEELRAVVERPGGITDAEMKAAEKYERELRHDVMAHVHALGDSCPKAKGIIHLGMTSQDVVCNSDLLTLEHAIELIDLKMRRATLSLSAAASTWKALPALGYTHYQPAQPVTVGRRCALWGYELDLCAEKLSDAGIPRLPRRGLRGATGTQASFLSLLGDSHKRVDELDARFLDSTLEQQYRGAYDGVSLREHADGAAARLSRLVAERRSMPAQSTTITDRLEHRLTSLRNASDDDLKCEAVKSTIALRSFSLTGQTYPRVIDTFILADLASCASVLHKIATDIRLLCNRKELDEPFEDKQIGSSAMPYKRNPMRCERICGLTRFVMNLVGNAYDTTATQWLERTLDDSSNRRLSLPEAFLALDGALDLMHNVASGLIVHEAMVRKNLMAELPFMATENILMACVKLGGDRQHYHELIRQHAQAAGLRVKQEGLDNDLLDRLKVDKNFQSKARGGALSAELDWEGVMDPMKYIGRSVEQTERFIKDVVEPLREQYGEAIAKLEDSGPKV
ncbi:MAG: adenylosuccinate lyase [Phycisphaeraceae bacterium]|nr:adenylosuccinate lyase [Phycisphaeraceae bacterium]